MAKETLYSRRVAVGLCGPSGCPFPPLPGKSVCSNHMEKARLKSAARRASQQASGLCVVTNCTEKPSPGRIRCEKHLKESLEAQKAKAAGWKAAGFCVGGGPSHGPVKAGCVLCQKCIDDRSKVAAARYHRQKAAHLQPSHDLWLGPLSPD